MKTLAIIFTLFLASPIQAKLKKGAMAPDFTLKEIVSEKKQTLSKFKDKLVVLEWHSPLCSFSRRHAIEKTMINLVSKYDPKGVVWFGVDSSGKKYYPGINRYVAWIMETGLNYPVLRDETGKIGNIYGAQVTPHMVIINKGKVVYQGAIDDDTFGDKPGQNRKNYVSMALSSLVKNKKLPKGFKQFRHAYGCGIKY